MLGRGGADSAAGREHRRRVAVDLGSVLPGLDERNIAGVARAVLHAAGHPDLRVAAGGERR